MARMLAPLLTAWLLTAAAASAAGDPTLLGTSLTPLGGERAGNADGSIPPWTGGIAPAPPAQPRPDPFAREAPLYAITAANLAQFADRLPDGQKALFRRNPGYRIEVYPTHRTAAAPQSVYDATRANASRARLNEEGAVEGAVGGIPFPLPQSGLEVVWNHLLAWWGPAREDRVQTWVVSSDGSLDLTNDYRETVDFPYYYPGATPATLNGYYFKRREISLGPAALAGRGYIAWQPLDANRDRFQAWQYLPAQRRVRASPTLAYDVPTPDGAGIQSFDDYYLFSGPPDRYQFRLLGKQEMIVPYNNNRFYLRPVRDVAGPHHANPEHLRYELHRVWVVEATLAPGQRHLAPRRRFYFDEDSWFALYADAWDADGNLWKHSHATMYVVPDLPAVVLGSDFIYDLQNGGYVLAFAFNELKQQFRPTPPHRDSDFQPDTLAAEGVR